MVDAKAQIELRDTADDCSASWLTRGEHWLPFMVPLCLRVFSRPLWSGFFWLIAWCGAGKQKFRRDIWLPFDPCH